MKAYIVEAILENDEVPFTDNVFNGPNYSDMKIRAIVIAETSSKARYGFVSLLHFEEIGYEYTIGELLCITTVRRTKRKYEYKDEIKMRLFDMYRFNYDRPPR
jgi:hypothetical protein